VCKGFRPVDRETLRRSLITWRCGLDLGATPVSGYFDSMRAANAREHALVGDPQMPGRPGILTRSEHAACLSVLRLVESRPTQALECVGWCHDDQRALIALETSGFVQSAIRSEVWNRLELTERGRVYLQQISEVTK
jgi:hypothetical protein